MAEPASSLVVCELRSPTDVPYLKTYVVSSPSGVTLPPSVAPDELTAEAEPVLTSGATALERLASSRKAPFTVPVGASACPLELVVDVVACPVEAASLPVAPSVAAVFVGDVSPEEPAPVELPAEDAAVDVPAAELPAEVVAPVPADEAPELSLVLAVPVVELPVSAEPPAELVPVLDVALVPELPVASDAPADPVVAVEEPALDEAVVSLAALAVEELAAG